MSFKIKTIESQKINTQELTIFKSASSSYPYYY